MRHEAGSLAPWVDASAVAPTPTSRTTLRRHWHAAAVWLELIRNLAVRDIETRYKRSFLGLYWAVVNPLITALIMTFLFQVIFHASSKPIPYVVYVVTNLTLWNFFGNSLVSATGCITGSASLLAKLYFPRIVLPTASVVARLIDLGFSCVVVAIFILIFRVHVYWTAMWVVPIFVVELVFALGLAYLVACVNVILRDTSQLVGLVLMMWMYLSPVMYSLHGQPEAIQTILLVNPMGAVLQADQDLLFTGHLTHPAALWAAGVWCVFVLLAGITVFKRVEPLFSEVM